MDIFSFLFLISVSVPIAVWRKVAIERAIIISISFLCFVGYIGGMLGDFWYLLFPTEVFLLGLMVVCIYKKKITIKELLSPGIIFLLILLVISIIYHRNTVVMSWDDLACWAAETKNMFYNNQFPCAVGNTISRYTDYLPGVQLFAVIWMKVGNTFNDSRLFVSYNMLAYIFLAAFLTKVRGKLKIVLFSIMLAVAPNTFFANGWSMLSTLQIDTMVATMFGYLLYLIYTEEYDVVELYAGIAMLCLSKQVGCLLGLVVIGLLCIKQIYQRAQKKDGNRNILFIAIGEFLFIVSSWYWVKKKYNVVSTGSGVYKELLNQGLDYFSTLEKWEIEGFTNFWKSLIKFDVIDITSQTAYYISPYLKVSGIVWVTLLFIGLIFISKKYCKNIVYFYDMLLFLGFGAYTIFISSLYLLNFSEGENAVLSSAGRYVGTYLMALYLLISGVVFRYSKETMLNMVNIVFVIIGLVFPCNNSSSTLIGGVVPEVREEKKEIFQERSELQEKMNVVMNVVGNDANIIMDNGFYVDNAKYNYLLFPNKVALWGYIWQLNPSYTHIILNNDTNALNEEFVNTYGKYFGDSEIVDGGIYKINFEGEKIILKYIGRMPK